ncbi:acyltransferase [Xylaria bambusicola]|uniref:acyltransferase n=1 Tax=Xylaria bambusicola TaxID=326684 RepID=UPI0020087992|nr:acyltransferase [Xylaria bambusicola]KAI0512775.1 acyltransferase [Xylaria bambusicola]
MSSRASSPTSEMPPLQPSLPQRMTSSLVMGVTAGLSRLFIYGLNSVEVTGLERFLDILDKRKDVDKRQRGLITVCNHVSVFDDPIMWGVLPFAFHFNPSNHRWSLGAHDICFKNAFLNAFFSAGQVLPTYRLQHSPHGGLFQPTVPQAIKLLSSRPFLQPGTSGKALEDETSISGLPPIYTQNRYSWVHVFPEACVHQHPKMFMRYFKWGVSRMILESEPMPDVLPIFIDGTQHMMSENREWPRFLPRFGVKFRVAFGEPVDTQKIFGDVRARWQELVRREQSKSQVPQALGELPDELKYGDEAVKLRIEVARRVRDEVLKVRASLNYPDEEPRELELAETWRGEPGKDRFKSNVDASLVNKRQ